MASLHQISVSDGGVPKRAINSADITVNGVTGDRQRDTVDHGGPDRAVCLFSLEVIEGFQSEGHPIQPGFAGENLTVAGLDWDLVVPGRQLSVGPEVELEITSYTAPCATNADWFKDGKFGRMSQTRHPGESRVYARVLREGPVTVGNDISLLG